MLFNSYIFIFAFLPVTFIIYFFLNKKKMPEYAKAFLVSSSLFFYSWWNIIYLPLILLSMIFNYLFAKLLKRDNKHRKIFLFFGIFINVLLLAYFKYYDFFLENINSIFMKEYQLLHLALPLAISFFTFQQIAYLVDSYRGETDEYNFLNYALFVTFFPQLIAGPIVHHSEMMPQFSKSSNRFINYKNISLGIFIFTIGLFKKVMIADTFAMWATNGFDKLEVLTFIEAWATSLSYTFQLYFDFSGYTDMAIGVALLFNIKLPSNFNNPYRATSIQDFWRRWHITLSRFLRDYIYIPLGGNRKGEARTYLNLITTFLLGGLWHGAGWTFIFWGFLHGLALAIHRFWSTLGFRLWKWLGWFITFNFINISWVFFRAKEWGDAIKVLSGMFGFSGFSVGGINVVRSPLPPPFEYFFHKISIGFNLSLLLLTVIAVLVIDKKLLFKLKKYTFFYRVMIISILLVTLMNLRRASEFLYFNF